MLVVNLRYFESGKIVIKVQVDNGVMATSEIPKEKRLHEKDRQRDKHITIYSGILRFHLFCIFLEIQVYRQCRSYVFSS